MRRRMGWLLAVCGLFALLATFGGVSYAADPVHWTYDGEEGPEHWGDLSPDYALCSAGQEQSPVDIPANAPVNQPNLTYNYKDSAVNIFNNGHTVQVAYDPGSTLMVGGQQYELVQFHFHAHSEHTSAGASYPMELHLVHRNAENKLAVVGVWMESGQANAAFDSVLNNLPATVGDPQAVPGATVNAGQLLPSERTYVRYNGSLTTPPCAESVTWLMHNQPVAVSDAQLASFTSLFDHDFRPTQPMNGRSFISGDQAAAPQPAPAPLPSAGAADSAAVWALLALAGLALVAGLVLRRQAAR